MGENREAWLVAGSSLLVTLFTLVAVFGFGSADDEPGSTPLPVAQLAAPSPMEVPSEVEGARPHAPDSPSSSPAQAVDRLLVAWTADDRVAARRVASQVAVERFFEEPLEYRPDFYLAGCDKHRGDWSCSLGYGPDNRVGYSLGIERYEASFWVGFADLIVL